MSSKPATRRILLAQVLLTVILVAVFLIVGEVAVRLFARDVNFLGTSSDLFVLAAHNESHGNAPNVKTIAYGVEVTTDENGFRIDPGSPRRGPARGREAILFLGDSMTFAPGVKDGATYPDIISRHAASRVYNGGSIGWGVLDYLNYVEATLIPERERLGVRHVVLSFCLNDISARSKATILAMGQKAQRTRVYPAPVEWLRRNTSSINAFLRTRSRLFLYAKGLMFDTSRSYFFADSEKYGSPEDLNTVFTTLKRMSKLLGEADITFTVVVFPYEYQLRSQDGENLLPQEKLRSFAQEAGIRFIDTYSDFLSDMRENGRDSKDYFLYNDPMHLNELGHSVASDILVRQLEFLSPPQ